MTTGEDLNDRILALNEAGKQLQVHAIFNTHGSAKDALTTTSFIEPDSIVYNERYDSRTQLHPEDYRSPLQIAEDLAAYKRTHGKDETYLEARDANLDFYDQHRRAYRRSTRPRFFGGMGEKRSGMEEHGFTLMSKLLEKDCQVMRADFVHASGSMNEKDMELQKMMNQALNGSEYDLFDSMQLDGDPDEYLHQLTQIVSKYHKAQHIRERYASNLISIDTLRMVEIPEWFADAPKTESGKIKAYLIYGTAHARSLTAKLEERNVEVVTRSLKTLPEFRYFDSTVNEFEQNLNRRVAHAAFMAMLKNYQPSFRAAVINKTAQETYEIMEGIRGGPAVDFCISCIKLNQRSKKSLLEHVRVGNEFRDLTDKLKDSSLA